MSPPRKSVPRPRFMVDAMLGNVAKDLRLLGFDAEFAGCRPDAEILRLSQAEGRFLVTRDRELAERAGPAMAIRVDAEEPLRQMIEVLRGIGPNRSAFADPLSVCLECNGKLRPASREDVRDRVADHVAVNQADFRECRRCGRVYWSGSHLAGLRERLRRLEEALQARGRQV